MPMRYRLYYYDSEKGWSYPTGAGDEVGPDPDYLATLKADVRAWSRAAVERVLAGKDAR